MPGFGPHQASRRRRNTGNVTPTPSPTPSPSPTLSAISGTFTLAESATPGMTAGTLTGRTTGSTLTLFDDAGARVAISGTNILAGLTALDFETATSHAFTVRETLTAATNTPRDTVLTLSVTDVDEIPNGFTFTDVTGAIVSTIYTSNTITVAGLGSGVSVPVSITGGTYSANGAAYTSAAGTAVNGDTFAVRQTSSASASTAVHTVLTIGGVSDTYTTTTAAAAGLAYTAPVVAISMPQGSHDLSAMGSALVAQSRIRRAVLDQCNSIRIGMSKSKQSNNAGTEGSIGTNTQTYKAIIEVAGVQYPVTWSGAASVTWASAAFDLRLSDAVVLPVDLMAGDTIDIWSETIWSAAFIASKNTHARDANDLQATSTTSTPPTTLGTSTSGWNSVATVGPGVVVASRLTDKPPLLYKGDSNMVDQVGNRDAVHAMASFPRATIGSGRGVHSWCASGNTLNNNKAVPVSKITGPQLGAQHAMVLLGTNDLVTGRTLANMQADAETLRANYAAAGITAHFFTLPPCQSGDPFSAIRIAYNNWLRGSPAGFASIYDLADATETARDSGVWKASHSVDFLHINWGNSTTRAAVLADHAAWLTAQGLF